MKKNINKRALGTQYEDQTASFLEESGYVIIERNYRCRIGEIDLVASDGSYLVFIEVKYRTSMSHGGAIFAVDFKKQKTISTVAMNYLVHRRLSMNTPCRFDVAAVSPDGIEIIKDAFPFRR